MVLREPANTTLSGAAYVAALMRQADSPEDQKLSKLVIRKPHNCDHKAYICADCAHEWNWDYQLLLDRTAGGRKMREELPDGWEERPVLS